jgi:hypothetical protein
VNVRGPRALRVAPHHDSAPAKEPVTDIVPQERGRFGEPSSYSLTAAELARHVRQLRRGGWLAWEVRARFGRWAA